MKIQSQYYHTIWVDEQDPALIRIIDQRFLPHEFRIETLKSSEDVFVAIREMWVRGAPLIGATAAFGIYLSALEAVRKGQDKKYIIAAATHIQSARPTAVDLFKAIKKQMDLIDNETDMKEIVRISLNGALEYMEESIAQCKKIGEFGLDIISKISKQKNGKTVNILTHCNAGWLATVDYGTATAPIYLAFDQGIDLHVWVDETRPRNQGARLTAFELLEHGVPHTLIADNTGGHLMQHAMVDMVIVGTDRTTANGDVANKIGTYLKALAAYDNGIPFYVAAPSGSIDFDIRNGLENIEIEVRDPNEIKYINGKHGSKLLDVLLCPEDSSALNYGFDVTPARLISGIITERGVAKEGEKGLKKLFPEKYS
jgi:methylthioribose-1-phosphate isomerase